MASPSKKVLLMSINALAETNQGGRPHMEDYASVTFEPDPNGGQAFVAVFDGHGGRHASSYAKKHIWKNIKRQKGFDIRTDHDKVLSAIGLGFQETQDGMWKAVESWPSARPGVRSTAGTTVSLAIVRGCALYIGHLGDSGIVLGRDEGDQDAHGQRRLTAVRLTQDHKPELESEKSRIEALGGEVKPGNGGVLRVVWNRVRQPHTGPILRSTEREQVPFLSVSRSLGDLWSYNFERKDYLVSPIPDLSVRYIDVKRDRFIVLGSDGLWGVVSPQDAVKFVDEYKEEDGKGDVCHALIVECLSRWRARRLRADNISVVILYFHEPKSLIQNSTQSAETQSVQAPEQQISNDDGPSSKNRKRPAEKACVEQSLGSKKAKETSDAESSPSDVEYDEGRIDSKAK